MAQTPMKLGPCLTLDPDTATVTHCDGRSNSVAFHRAQQLAKGSYRKPYTLSAEA